MKGSHPRNPALFPSLLIFVLTLLIWLSALSLIPVPWPDDSAFYLVAKDLFSWPPRWVMLSQAPWEPSYEEWNFNTMPLFPILIGLGRLVGIDGIWAIKFWPLLFWAISGIWLLRILATQKARDLLLWATALAWCAEPVLRWSSMIVRPESLIAVCGMVILGELIPGPSPRSGPRHAPQAPLILDSHTAQKRIAPWLAIAAYAHFNAIHLVGLVLGAALLGRFGSLKQTALTLLQIGIRTSLWLSPWIVTVLLKPALFVEQMRLQWSRLAVPNSWLESWGHMKKGILEQMGSMAPWPDVIEWSAPVLWAGVILSGILFFGVMVWFWSSRLKFKAQPKDSWIRLGIAASWVISASWLFHTKPEVWFTHYLHASLIAFGALLLHELTGVFVLRPILIPILGSTVLLHVWGTLEQHSRISDPQSWSWKNYHQMVDCVDRQLSALEQRKGKPLRVWVPTFPDITIELSLKHPQWRFTRTCDFLDRSALAIQHGLEVDAIVVPETYAQTRAQIDAQASEHPQVQSVWMNWRDYFLNALYTAPGFKPQRHICQAGAWQAFLFQ